MTACVNNKKYGRRVAGVVTASLVGALTLGGVSLAAVPTVALAEQGADLQFGINDIVNSHSVKFTYSDPETGSAVSAPGPQYVDGHNVLFTANGTAYKLGVESFKLPSGKTVKVDKNFHVDVYTAKEDGSKGELVANSVVTGPGKYVLEFTGLSGSGQEGEVYTSNFTVAGKSFNTVTALDADGDVFANDHFFSGNAQKITFKDSVGGALTEGTDYEVTGYTWVSVDNKTTKDVNEVKDAGTYYAHLKGVGLYEGSTSDVAAFTIRPFVVGDSTVIKAAAMIGQSAQKNPASVATFAPSVNKTFYLDPSLVTLVATNPNVASGSNVVQYNVALDKDAVNSGNVVDSLSTHNGFVKGDKADYAATLKYAGKELQDSYTFDISQGSWFDLSGISASSDKVKLGAVSSSQVAVTDGGAAAFKKHKAGTYKVTVNFWKQGSDSKYYAATKTFTVVYKAGSVDADSSLYVYYNGDKKTAITSYTKAYDGQELKASDFTVAGTTSEGDAVKDKDVTKKLVDKDGNEVNSAKDAGDYKLVVSSDKYALSGTTELPITIAKVDLTSVSVDALEKWNAVAGETYLPLSDAYDSDWGSLSQYLTNTAANAIKSLKLDWAAPEGIDKALPSNVGVSVEYQDGTDWKQVGSINDFVKSGKKYVQSGKGFGEGHYRVTLSVSSDAAANYVLPEGKTQVTLEFNAYNKQKFSDVQPSDWFYGSANKAAQNGYMNGYAGTTTFGPYDPITRGQVAVVLFNMSGADSQIKDDESNASYDKDHGWKTGFSDVDGEQGFSGEYYAKAVYWAKRTGVVNGYGDGTFQPNKTVSREEFAAMLANYAKVVNRDEKVDAAEQSALDKFADAAQVDAWARQSVAWAVQNGIMGKGGSINADGTLVRAEAAAMAVDYQPEAKKN